MIKVYTVHVADALSSSIANINDSHGEMQTEFLMRMEIRFELYGIIL